jgi:hypothetical protein
MHTSWLLFHPFYTVCHCYGEGQDRPRIALSWVLVKMVSKFIFPLLYILCCFLLMWVSIWTQSQALCLGVPITWIQFDWIPGIVLKSEIHRPNHRIPLILNSFLKWSLTTQTRVRQKKSEFSLLPLKHSSFQEKGGLFADHGKSQVTGLRSGYGT